jgi:hypothetical protein
MNHPITPTPELIEEWAHLFVDHTDAEVFSAVARWGANQELKACVTYVAACGKHVLSDSLQSARRPKSMSLKEQALALVEQHEDGWRPSPKDWDSIRRALESINE